MVALSRKFEIVAPVKVVFRNRLKSMNGASLRRSTKKNAVYAAMAATARPRTVALVPMALT